MLSGCRERRAEEGVRIAALRDRLEAGLRAAVPDMVVNGDVNVSGPATLLTLNGKTLRVTGTFDMNNNATVVMSNPADSLILEYRRRHLAGGA